MVHQLINNRGNCAANQFVITANGATYFQSYTSVVAKIQNGNVYVSTNWDYSRTTSKHLYIFLAQQGYSHLCSAKDMRKAIKDGEVILIETSSLSI